MPAHPAPLPNDRDASGRLTASTVFPAGWPGLRARSIDLGAGEHARVVSNDASPTDATSASTPSGTGPAVLCLHGWGASAYGYRHVLAPLAARGIAAHAPDLRGHGWSGKPLDRTAYTPDALAGWTVRVLDALAVDRAVLVGHSLGGAIALHTARVAPDRVAALVLLAPLGLHTVERLEQLRALTPDFVERWVARAADFRVLTAVALHTAYGRLGRPTARDVDEYWAPTADPAFARAARLVFHADPWGALAADALAGVRRPVEVVVGTRDNLIRAADFRLAASLPHAALDVVPDAGHVLADEVPARVLAAVARARAAAGRAERDLA